MRDTEILNLDSTAKVELDFGSPSGQAFVQPTGVTCIRCKFSSTLQTSVLPGMPNIAPVVSMAPVVSTPLPSLPDFSWASLPLPPAPTLPQAGWNLLQKALLRIWKEYFWMDCVSVRPAHWQVKGLKNSYCKHRILFELEVKDQCLQLRGVEPWPRFFTSTTSSATLATWLHQWVENSTKMQEMGGCHVLELNIGLPR